MTTPHYIDTHAHLFFSDYSEDIDEVLYRSKKSNVDFIIIPGTDLKSSIDAVRLSEQHENIFACVGIHPHEVKKASNDDLIEIEELSKKSKVVAIGEIGLDYHYDFSPRDTQKVYFSAQIEIAVKRNLPIVVHTRKSIEDAFKIVQKAIEEHSDWKESNIKPKRGVFHCFPGTASEAEHLYKLGFYISYPGIITFKKSESIEIIKNIGLKHILLETDSPYMTPEPHRGKRNEPANIVHIGRKIAKEFDISETELARITSENAMSLFGIKQ